MLRTRTPLVIKSIATLMLPFNLHVLSLPPAFILSQDQTLHCICFFFQSSDCLLSVLSPASISSKESTWIFAALSIYFKELSPHCSLAVRECKSTTFFFTFSLYPTFFSLFFIFLSFWLILSEKKFCKNPFFRFFIPFFRTFLAKITLFSSSF